jgi:ECF sigma factor
MSPNSDSGPTELLRAWSQGDGSALDRLVPLVYEELHHLARRYMRQERSDHTLQPTSPVNEAYLRLAVGTAVERDDPGFMNHLAVNQHIAGRLNNLMRVIVAGLDAPDTSGAEAQASFWVDRSSGPSAG